MWAATAVMMMCWKMPSFALLSLFHPCLLHYFHLWIVSLTHGSPGGVSSKLLISRQGQRNRPTHPQPWIITNFIWVSVNHLFTSCRWVTDTLTRLRRLKTRREDPVIPSVSLSGNDSVQVKIPVTNASSLQVTPDLSVIGQFGCHIYTAWLGTWSGKLKESLKRKQPYLFKSKGRRKCA